MWIHTLRRKQIAEALSVAGLVAAAGVLLTYPEAARTGISRGMSVCGAVILPTLFPFMLLSGLLAESPLCRRPGRLAAWIAGRLFGLPACCAPAILLGWVGGYPAGMLAVTRLYRRGQIDGEQLRRLSAFCISGGPGFIISTVGVGLMGNMTAGILLFAAQTAAALVIGLWLGRGHRRAAIPLSSTATEPPRPLAAVVGDTCAALLTMCGFVLLAAMTLSLAEGTGLIGAMGAWTGIPAADLSAAVAAVLEVSCGCVALAGREWAPLWLSLALSWAGLSVQGQLSALLPEVQLLTPRFWGWRIAHGLLSGGLAVTLFRWFPVDRQTAALPQALPYSVSMPASVMMLLLCFLAMLCFSEKKTGNRGNSVL